jgi:hypothetical protein
VTDLTRRVFVKNTAGAAAGVTLIGALLAEQAQAKPGSDPVMAYVKDARTGEISLLSADREVTVHDKRLAAQIARAAH